MFVHLLTFRVDEGSSIRLQSTVICMNEGDTEGISCTVFQTKVRVNSMRILELFYITSVTMVSDDCDTVHHVEEQDEH